MDTAKLIEETIIKREMDPENSDLLVGFDGGQGSLKVALTITEKQEPEKLKRSRYSEVYKCKYIFHIII